MSIVFDIQVAGPPPIDVALSGIKTARLESHPPLPADGAWPEGLTNLHLPRFSTRTTEVTWEPDAFTVKLFSLASESDTVLALRLVENVATWSDASINCDVHGVLSAAELAEHFPPDFWRHQAESGVGAVTALVNDGRGPIQIPGPVRSFHVGTRMLERFRRDTDHDTVDRWMTAMLRVQYFGLDNDDEHFGGLFEATRDNDEVFQFVIWTPNPIWAMPDVEVVAIAGDEDAGEDVFFIPAEAVEQIADGDWEWLDEKQRVVFGFGEDRWAELREKARRFSRVDT